MARTIGQSTTPLTRWRRPHRVTLPGGYTFPVVYWSARRIQREAKGAEVLLGYWDGQRIVINAGEPLWKQIEVFGHEMVHAVHDYALWLAQRYAEPIAQEAGQTALDLREEGEE